jgi:hypothetical protein
LYSRSTQPFDQIFNSGILLVGLATTVGIRITGNAC